MENKETTTAPESREERFDSVVERLLDGEKGRRYTVKEPTGALQPLTNQER